MTMLPPASPKKLGLVIDLDTCVGCHACAVACKQWNDGGQFGPLPDEHPYGKDPLGVWFNRVHTYEVTSQASEPARTGTPAHLHSPHPAPAAQDRPSITAFATSTPRTSDTPAHSHNPDPAPAAQDRPLNLRGLKSGTAMTVHFPRSCLHCETPDCVTVCPTGASCKRAEDGIVLVDEDKCIGCKLCSWACPYGAREYSQVRGTMQKCTLCVDRIYNESFEEVDRQPACVMACPTRARHFGDLGDPDSAVSRLVAERGGYGLMPEMGYKPVNQYLPPRPRRDGCSVQAAPAADDKVDFSTSSPLLRWIDKVLSR
jgi:Fe-S-cluster-containing dehydrogenase component